MQILEDFAKMQKKGAAFSTETLYAQNELVQSPLFKAMLDLNIIWKSKYYDFMHVEHFLYVGVIEDWLERRLQGMNRYERLLFWLYKKNHKAVKVSKTSQGVGPAKATSTHKSKSAKGSY